MKKMTSESPRRLAFLILGAAFIAVTVWGNLRSGGLHTTAEARVEPGVYSIITSDLKYKGNASCAGSDCHTADEATKQSGQLIGDESNIWSDWDPHAEAYRQLQNEESKEIASKLGIEKATASSRCLTCHAMDVPQEQRGELFSIDNAVGCESCHGASEKWLEPHAKAGWTAEKRDKLGAQGLIDEYGLNDTTHVSVRAHTCVSCHLQIDKDMIDAGHPPLEFELYAYSYYVSDEGEEFYQHWNERQGVVIDARLWAAGQIAAYQAAENQVADWRAEGWDTAEAQNLLKLYTHGYEVVKEVFGVETAKAVHEMDNPTAEQCATAAEKLAAYAPEAENERERRIIGYGVSALGSSAFAAEGREVPDAFWQPYNTVTSGEGGQDYINGLQHMVETAKNR